MFSITVHYEDSLKTLLLARSFISYGVLLEETISDKTELQSSKWDPNLENMAIYVDIGTLLIALIVIAGVNILIAGEVSFVPQVQRLLKYFYKKG